MTPYFRIKFILLLLLPLLAFAEEKCLYEWTFETEEKIKPWVERSNMVSDVHCENGVLKGVSNDWDPWFISPDISVSASFRQFIEVELKSETGGRCQIFYTDSSNAPHSGFTEAQSVWFDCIGDNQWHTYRVRMFWPIRKLLRIRFDLPPVSRKSFGIRRLRIVDPGEPQPCVPVWNMTDKQNRWQVKAGCKLKFSDKGLTVISTHPDAAAGIENWQIKFSIPDYGSWLTVAMAVRGARTATLEYFTSVSRSPVRKTFNVVDDGNMHYYNIDMSGEPLWDGDAYALALTLPKGQDAKLTVKQIRVGDEPFGPAVICTEHDGLTNALNRVNRPAAFSFRIRNVGGTTADVRIANLKLPEGVSIVPGTGYPEGSLRIKPFCTKVVTFNIISAHPVKGPYRLVLAYDGGKTVAAGTLEITQSLGLPETDYVPEPQPPESDYEIGAFYFPGWGKGHHWGWQKIYDITPERKPVLGWYDEGNPECVDWQIKWLAENGISYLLVDWYWCKGPIALDHWIKAFYRCRYRKYMKWAVMWANHTKPGTHSLEDMETVTHYWIDNYFKTPEYYKIDGKPVVMMWSPDNMERDMKDRGGARALIDLANRIAKEAGFPGIHFSSIKWPEPEATVPQIQRLADMGFESTAIYHYMDHGGKAADSRRFPFEFVAETNRNLWEKSYDTGILPFFTCLSTGWDDRPWNDTCEIYGRNPALFKKICADAKAFADRTGLKKRILLAPVNEWGGRLLCGTQPRIRFRYV